MRFSSPRLSSLLSWQTMEKPSTSYALVSDQDVGEDDLPVHHHSKRTTTKYGLRMFGVSAIALVIGILLGTAIAHSPQNQEVICNSTGERESLLYSPAQDAVRYEVRRFNASFRTDITEYQGPPSEAIDKKWEDLYRYGVNQIPASEANKLVDKTVPIPNDEDNYIVTLEVFHQLHCLNLLRKSLYPDHYPSTLLNHLEHCVDILRQALTCTVDINPLSWEWYEPRRATETKLDGVHQCVNFQKIQEWAYEHRLMTAFDDSINLQLGHEHHHG